ncbi:MAG: hypothetical protein K5838_04080 [Elusimicrobiales bacterium]|nr:hypothetical protein [Elusimicrobiales bacterium]
MSETIELFSKGPLGTCWYGKYHYMEPWTGCEHSCPYCYARSRKIVLNTLEEKKTQFNRPVPLFPEEELLRRIKEKADSGEIDILKLSRYTDIFTPSFAGNGLSYQVIKTLAESKIRRIIITTKGIPDEQSLQLMEKYKEKFSYNEAVRPSAALNPAPLESLDRGLKKLSDRLDAAARLNAAGVKTTIHLDPMVAGIDDSEEAITAFLDMLRERRLNRVMFSYLLFSSGMMPAMKEAMPAELLKKIMADYDFTGTRSVLPGQEDTASQALKNEAIKASAEKMADALNSRGFEFVLCSLKSVKGFNHNKYKKNMICDGTFYA